MKKKASRGKQLFANRLHLQLFFTIALAAIIPATVIAIALYYLIFNITAEQMAIPEAIAYNLIPAANKVNTILLVIMPLIFFIILFGARKITHSIVGPYTRIERELTAIAAGSQKGQLTVRKSDKFRPLVDAINRILAKNNT